MGAEYLVQARPWVVPQPLSPHPRSQHHGSQAHTHQIASLCHHQACQCPLRRTHLKQHQKIRDLNNGILVHHRKLSQRTLVPQQPLPTIIAIIVVTTTVTATVIITTIIIVIIVIIPTTVTVVVKVAQKLLRWTLDFQCHHLRLPACAVVQLLPVGLTACLDSQELHLYSLAEQGGPEAI